MPRVRILPTRIHGILDYLAGLGLILSPWLGGFADVGGAAVALPIGIGVSLIIYSLCTDYERGLLRMIPMGYHLTIDFAAAVLLALSPWIFSFYDEKVAAWATHVLAGLVLMAVVLISQTSPRAPATSD